MTMRILEILEKKTGIQRWGSSQPNSGFQKQDEPNSCLDYN